MTIKRAFFSVFAKIMVFCGIMMGAFYTARADDACKNLFDADMSKSNFALNNNVFSNKAADSRDFFKLQFQIQTGGNSFAALVNEDITNAGKYNFTFVVPDTNILNMKIKHDGRSLDLNIPLNTVLSAGTYTLSLEILSANPKTAGGIQLKDIQIERGETATSYSPYTGDPLCATCDGTVVVENGESRCVPVIKIATNAYNDAQFVPVETALNSAVATIKNVVANTITQTAAIAEIASDKQSRPDSECPAGKTCLLVEDADGTPHWYEIIENIYGLPSGYTALEYIESTGTQYIDTGVVPKTFDYEITTVGTFDRTSYGPNGMWGYINISGAYPRWTLSTYMDRWLPSSNATAEVGVADTLKHTFVNMVYMENETPYSKFYIDGEQLQQVAISDRPETWADNTLSIYLFGRNRSGNFGDPTASKIYRHIVKKNGTVIQDLIPAKNSSNVVGMYDTVTNTFYTNAGTGTFVAGPAL